MKIETSSFDTLPCVMFTNTKRGNTRCVFVCTSADIADAEAARLQLQAHIADVEVVDAIVKHELSVQPKLSPRSQTILDHARANGWTIEEIRAAVQPADIGGFPVVNDDGELERPLVNRLRWNGDDQ